MTMEWKNLKGMKQGGSDEGHEEQSLAEQVTDEQATTGGVETKDSKTPSTIDDPRPADSKI